MTDRPIISSENSAKYKEIVIFGAIVLNNFKEKKHLRLLKFSS